MATNTAVNLAIAALGCVRQGQLLQPTVEQAGQTQIGELERTGFVDETVVRLQVTMDQRRLRDHQQSQMREMMRAHAAISNTVAHTPNPT
jgi:hypothetical protein